MFNYLCEYVKKACESGYSNNGINTRIGLKLSQRIIDEYAKVCPCTKHLNRHQPERSKREDSQQCEMRCSEHCGNTVRGK